MNRDRWFYVDEQKPLTDAQRITALEELVRHLAEHMGADLDVIKVVNASAFRDDCATDWHSCEVRRELDDLEDYLERGEALPPTLDARGRTLRRHLTAIRSRRAVIG